MCAPCSVCSLDRENILGDTSFGRKAKVQYFCLSVQVHDVVAIARENPSSNKCAHGQRMQTVYHARLKTKQFSNFDKAERSTLFSVSEERYHQ